MSPSTALPWSGLELSAELLFRKLSELFSLFSSLFIHTTFDLDDVWAAENLATYILNVSIIDLFAWKRMADLSRSCGRLDTIIEKDEMVTMGYLWGLKVE